MGYHLEQEQLKLLGELVEEERNAPREDRQWFLVRVMEGDFLQGPRGSQRTVLLADIEELELAGLLRRQGEYDYVTTPAARRLYVEQREGESAPAESAEREVRSYLDGATFASAYPGAHGFWAQAQTLLWGADSEQELTTVGHKAREAMQAFASELVDRYQPDGIDPDPARVNRRVGAVIATMLPNVSDARGNLLRALGDYSEAAMALIQRQEHGAQKEGEPLNWTDARRVVLSVAMVMFEFSAVLSESEVNGMPPRGSR
jgi:hypothetical protein